MGLKDAKAIQGVRALVISVSRVPWQGRSWDLAASPGEPALFPASQKSSHLP